MTGCGKSNKTSPKNPIFQTINVGFNANGADFVDENNNTIWINKIDLMLDSNIESNLTLKRIKNYNSLSFYNLHKQLKNAKFLVFWLTKDWKKDWFDIKKIQNAVNLGYIPVFNYWYFGDTLATNFPTDGEIDEYFDNVRKLSLFLSEIKGQKLLIFEPEFNKHSVISDSTQAKKFASIISQAIDIVKSNNSNVLISLCMTDTGSRNENSYLSKCGYENCALGDKYEWGKPDVVYKYLINKLDFISFQEMVGQFSKNPKNRNEPISYTPEERGIQYLANRIINISNFLYNKYNKPVFLPYMAIASGVWTDYNNDGEIENNEINGSGWNRYILLTYSNLRKDRKVLLQNGLFGYAPMMLFDHPRHGDRGNHFFLQNEYYLGIISTGANPQKDKHLFGDLKPKGDSLLDYIFSFSEEKKR